MNNVLNAVSELKRWIDNTNNQLQTGMPFIRIQPEVIQVSSLINAVAENIHEEYPFYAKELPCIASILFPSQGSGVYSLNTCAFGELFLIIKHVAQEPNSGCFWDNIHPRVRNISKGLYEDKYYDSAAEKAMREVETMLRELFRQMKPSSNEPKNASDIMNALLSDDTLYAFDETTVSGKDYRKGIRMLFEAAFCAYRNPASHRNISASKRESLERIVLSSQLLYILENHRK